MRFACRAQSSNAAGSKQKLADPVRSNLIMQLTVWCRSACKAVNGNLWTLAQCAVRDPGLAIAVMRRREGNGMLLCLARLSAP